MAPRRRTFPIRTATVPAINSKSQTISVGRKQGDRFSLPRLTAMLALGFMLAACVQVAKEKPAATPTVAKIKPETKIAPAERPDGDISSQPTAKKSAAAAAAKAPSARQLLNKKPAFVLAQLGRPALRRADPPAAFWRYRDQACTLFIYLYLDATSGRGYRVRHLQANWHGAMKPKANLQPCFERFWRQRLAQKG